MTCICYSVSFRHGEEEKTQIMVLAYNAHSQAIMTESSNHHLTCRMLNIIGRTGAQPYTHTRTSCTYTSPDLTRERTAHNDTVFVNYFTTQVEPKRTNKAISQRVCNRTRRLRAFVFYFLSFF